MQIKKKHSVQVGVEKTWVLAVLGGAGNACIFPSFQLQMKCIPLVRRHLEERLLAPWDRTGPFIQNDNQPKAWEISSTFL